MKFIAVRKVPREIARWEESVEVPEGAICKSVIFDRVETISYKGKLICDADSRMAEDYFRRIEGE